MAVTDVDEALWCDPPAQPEPWRLRLAPCRTRPGCWRVVHQAPTSRAVRNAQAYARSRCPEPGWEFRSGRYPQGAGFAVWARYVGADE
jgi:hypothetical protein